MWDGPNLFRVFEGDWKRQGEGHAARAALRAWQAEEAVLARLRSPVEVVERCRVRDGDRAAANALLAAVLSRAGTDPWAARSVLQAVLPGLAAVSRRALGFVGPPAAVWQRVDELDQQVVATAYERITELAADPPAWPAAAAVDGTWQRVRAYALAECRQRSRRVGLDDAADAVSPSGATADEELVGVLVDAVQRGLIEPFDAGLVYRSGWGVTSSAAWGEVGRSPRSLWRRGQRVERQLARDAGGPCSLGA